MGVVDNLTGVWGRTGVDYLIREGEGLIVCGVEHKEPPHIGGVGGKAALRLALREAYSVSCRVLWAKAFVCDAS